MKKTNWLKNISVTLLSCILLLVSNFAISQTMDNPKFQTVSGITLKKELELKLKKDPSEHIYAVIEHYNFEENELTAKIGSDVFDETGKNILMPKDATLIGKYRFTTTGNEENIIIIWTLLGIRDKIIRLAPSNIWEKINKTKNAIILVSQHPYPSEWKACKNYCLERIKTVSINAITKF